MAWAQIEAKYILNYPNILKAPKQISERAKSNTEWLTINKH